MRDQRITGFEEGLGRSLRRLFPRPSRVLLAVSGGADSVALLSGSAELAARLDLTLEVATVDHGLRAEGATEAAAVAVLCGTLGLPHHTLKIVVDAGRGLEAAARDARYTALQTLRASGAFEAICTAHTADDQAETLLMRLARGTASGARGIHEARADGVVRPMLFATRAEVLAYLGARGLSFATDPMNADPAFLRVRMRREVLPVLQAVAGPQVVRALARFSSLSAEDESFLGHLASEALTKLQLSDGSLDGHGVLALAPPVQRRVLAAWLSAAGLEVDAEVIAEGLRALKTAGTATLPGDRLLACKNGRASIEPAPPRLHATSSLSHGRKGS